MVSVWDRQAEKISKKDNRKQVLKHSTMRKAYSKFRENGKTFRIELEYGVESGLPVMSDKFIHVARIQEKLGGMFSTTWKMTDRLITDDNELIKLFPKLKPIILLGFSDIDGTPGSFYMMSFIEAGGTFFGHGNQTADVKKLMKRLRIDETTAQKIADDVSSERIDFVGLSHVLDRFRPRYKKEAEAALKVLGL
jgi:hypothetical protein